MSLESDTRAENISLPEDDTIIEVSPWRRQIGWAFAAFIAVTGLSIAYKGFRFGDLYGLMLGIWGILLTVAVVRLPLEGIMLAPGGIKVRYIWWTYHWHWSEIDHFELKPRGYIPRLRIHLRNGRTKRVRGFLARSPNQEARAQALFRALEERLERGRQDQPFP